MTDRKVIYSLHDKCKEILRNADSKDLKMAFMTMPDLYIVGTPLDSRFIKSRQVLILIFRCGLLNCPRKTLKVLANHFHVTTERIRQIESRAIYMMFFYPFRRKIFDVDYAYEKALDQVNTR